MSSRTKSRLGLAVGFEIPLSLEHTPLFLYGHSNGTGQPALPRAPVNLRR